MSIVFHTEIQRGAWGPAAWTPLKALLETQNLSDVATYTCNLSTQTDMAELPRVQEHTGSQNMFEAN